MLRKKTGQSTLEYIILVTAVIALLIVFLKPAGQDGTGGGVFSTKLDDVLNESSEGMVDMSDRLSTSRGTNP